MEEGWGDTPCSLFGNKLLVWSKKNTIILIFTGFYTEEEEGSNIKGCGAVSTSHLIYFIHNIEFLQTKTPVILCSESTDYHPSFILVFLSFLPEIMITRPSNAASLRLC